MYLRRIVSGHADQTDLLIVVESAAATCESRYRLNGRFKDTSDNRVNGTLAMGYRVSDSSNFEVKSSKLVESLKADGVALEENNWQ